MARPSNRERILDSFEVLVLAHGIAGTALDAIAEHAGVSKGGLLYHFPSRVELFGGFTDRLLGRIDEAVASAPSEPVDVVRWYLDPDPLDDDDRQLWRSITVALHSVEEGTEAAIAAALERFTAPLRVLEPRLAVHVRLLGDGLFLNALLGSAAPSTPHLASIIDELIARIDGADH